MLRFFRLLRLATWRAFEHDQFAVAKASAYSSILTFFPALLVVGSVLATLSRGDAYLREVSYALGRILPTGAATAIAYLRGTNQRPVGLLISTSLLTLWTASGTMISWMEGFRNAYALPKTWGLLKERLIAFSLVIMAGIPLTFATVIALIYHNAVPRTQPWHSVLPGATLATALWFLTTTLFSIYLHGYADYSIIYGSLGVGIALLVWMYMISLIVLIGAEFNAMLFPRAFLGKELLESNATLRIPTH
jgi:membrane protein